MYACYSFREDVAKSVQCPQDDVNSQTTATSCTSNTSIGDHNKANNNKS